MKRELQARLYKTDGLSSLSVTDFIDQPHGSTPGSVGVCLSGGGSRALTAGMGQLLGLAALHNEAGSLLSQTKALSTVSGGSWVGVSFEYLNDPTVRDEDFLGTYKEPAALTVDDVYRLPEKRIAARIDSSLSALHILWEIILLLKSGTPSHLLWQTIIGIHILEYYSLYYPPKSGKESYFTLNELTRDKIVENNASLKAIGAHLLASGPDRIRRPWLVCNMAMFVNSQNSDFQYMVPVQATPLFTGVVSSPPGVTDFSGRPVGGGGTTSLSFNSDLLQIEQGEQTVRVNQQRLWSLMDSVGTSSAFYAEMVQNLAAGFEKSPLDFFRATFEHGVIPSAIGSRVAEYTVDSEKSSYLTFLKKLESLALTKELVSKEETLIDHLKEKEFDFKNEILPFLKQIARSINPLYSYWSVNSTEPDKEIKPTNFADGGDLENTGINALLTYGDVDSIISCINSETPLDNSKFGIIAVDGSRVENTALKISDQVPVLFGYQPYSEKNGGYITYKDKEGKFRPELEKPELRYNQVFPSDQFAPLLRGLREKADTRGGANYKQRLTTLENRWFGVARGRQVTIFWIYTVFCDTWFNLLSKEVQEEVLKLKGSKISPFPYYSTFNVELTKPQVNLLAHLTSWNIVESCRDEILGLFK